MDASNLTIDVENFPNVCRVCLHYGDFNSLLTHNYIDSVFETLKIITGIEIGEGDKLPKNICNTCSKQLCDIQTFIKVCKYNDTYLKSLLITEDKELLHDFDNFKDEESLDDNDDMLLSEYKVEVHSENRKYSHNEVTDEKEKSNLKKSKKRIEECECTVCGKKFTRKGGLKRHSKIHLGIKPFECEACGKTFVEKATLNRHYLIHTGEKPFECNLCGKATTRKDQILEHINKHHPNVVDYDFVITEHKTSEIDRKIIKKSKNNAIIQSGIPDGTEITEEVKFHKDNVSNNHTNFNSEVSEGEISNIDEGRQCKTKKRIEICLCNLCGKVFRRRGYLKNHMAIHAKIKPFECKTCGKGFTQRHALTRHNLVHTKERPFQCNLCGKTFTRKEILMDHLKNHEEGGKPYLCFHCGKCFSNKDYLSKHLKYYLPGKGKKKTTSEEKKCVCPQCGKQLHSVSYLKTHLLTHTGEKPYECNICGNRFTILRSLNHHLNIHKGVKPYLCTQCGKSFRTSGSLRKHNLLHTGERPFKCTSCEKGFIRRSHLKRHLRIH